MDTILAIDIGTSSAKAAVIARDGRILASHSVGYELHTGQGGEQEQDPEDWYRATQEAIRALGPSRFNIVALITTGQMQDLIVLQGAEVLRPAILYSDARATAEAEAMAEKLGESLTGITGNLQGASSLPAKLMWLKQHQPKVYQNADALLFGAHGYVAWRLTGTLAEDRTTASTTGLLSLDNRDWATDVLESLGLRTDWLPPLRNSGEALGTLSAELAESLSLPAGLPVLHGLGDAGAATIGSGAGEPGLTYLYLGTSGWLASSTSGERANPHQGVFTLLHPEMGRTILIGPMLTAGGNPEWMREQLGLDHTAFESLAASAPVGSNGLIYLPYLSGERSPFMSPAARAEFKHLSRSTTRADMARTVLEGVAFAFRSIAEAMQPNLTGQLFISGGGARSDLWCQIFADVLGVEVARLENPDDVGVRGAAILAGRALGWHTTLFPPGFFPTDAVFKPNAANVEAYKACFQRFLQANPYLNS